MKPTGFWNSKVVRRDYDEVFIGQIEETVRMVDEQNYPLKLRVCHPHRFHQNSGLRQIVFGDNGNDSGRGLRTRGYQ